ncbi:hypothetical protein [Fodinicola feengrottensis]
MTNSQPGSAQRAAGMAMLAAPVFVFLYGLVRLLGGRQGPGFGWTFGHLAFLVGLALFALVVLELRRQVTVGGGRWQLYGTVAAAVAGIGLLAQFGQILIDLMVGLQATTKTAMTTSFHQVDAIPGVVPAVYTVGPVLFYVGLLALVGLLAVRWPSRLTVASAVLVGIGVILPPIGLNLIPIAAVVLLVGLAVPGVRLLRGDAPTAAPRVAVR